MKSHLVQLFIYGDSGKVQKESSREALAGFDPGSLWLQKQESKPLCVCEHKWGRRNIQPLF